MTYGPEKVRRRSTAPRHEVCSSREFLSYRPCQWRRSAPFCLSSGSEERAGQCLDAACLARILCGPRREYGSAKFPACRELAGNFAHFTAFRAAFRGGKGRRIPRLLALNSLVTEQGISCSEQGMFRDAAGNLHRHCSEFLKRSQEARQCIRPQTECLAKRG